jgi:hypothetical protein
MPALVTNNATSTLDSGITAIATSLTVAAGEGARFPNPSSPNYFYATLAGTNGIEIVKVTARATDVFTIVRAQDGTTAKVYSAGETVELRPVAALFAIDALLPDQTSAANKLLVSNGSAASWSSNLSGLTLASPVLSGTATAVNMTFSGSLLVQGGTFPGVATTQVTFRSDTIAFIHAAASANERVWDIYCTSGVMQMRAVNDAYSSATSAISITRSGSTVSTVAFGAPVAVPVGSVSAPSLYFSGDSNTGFYQLTPGSVSVSLDGVDKYFFGANGLTVPGYVSTTESSTSSATRTVFLSFSDQLAELCFGTGAPTHAAAKGSLYIRTDGSSSSTRMYVNTNGSTTWTNVTTAA